MTKSKSKSKSKYEKGDHVILYWDNQLGIITGSHYNNYWMYHALNILPEGTPFRHDILDDEVKRKVSPGEARFITEVEGQNNYTGSYWIWRLHEFVSRQSSMPEVWVWRPICELMNKVYGMPVSAMRRNL